jgi:hypothetical protein
MVWKYVFSLAWFRSCSLFVDATVALGAAPLVLGALGALAAGRSALAGTAARRQAIQDDIAKKQAAAAAKKAAALEVDGGGLAAAVTFLGLAGASLVAIVANPLGGGETSFSLPSLPSINLPAATIGKPASAPAVDQPPSLADEARAKVRALQAERLAAKKAANEAKLATVQQPIAPARAQKVTKSSASEADSYDALFQRAAASGPQASISAKKEAPKKEAKETVSSASLGADEAQKALAEAKGLKAAKAEVKADAADANAKAAADAAKAAEQAKKQAEAEAAAAAKQFKADQEAAERAAQKAAAEKEKSLAAEKAAIARQDSAAVEKAATQQAKVEDEAAAAAKKASEDAKREAQAAQKAAAAEKAAEAAEVKARQAAEAAKAAEKAAAAEKAKAAAPAPAVSEPTTPGAGGKVLPKEEVSDETLAFIRSLKK